MIGSRLYLFSLVWVYKLTSTIVMDSVRQKLVYKNVTNSRLALVANTAENPYLVELCSRYGVPIEDTKIPPKDAASSRLILETSVLNLSEFETNI